MKLKQGPILNCKNGQENHFFLVMLSVHAVIPQKKRWYVSKKIIFVSYTRSYKNESNHHFALFLILQSSVWRSCWNTYRDVAKTTKNELYDSIQLWDTLHIMLIFRENFSPTILILKQTNFTHNFSKKLQLYEKCHSTTSAAVTLSKISFKDSQYTNVL